MDNALSICPLTAKMFNVLQGYVKQIFYSNLNVMSLSQGPLRKTLLGVVFK